MKRGAVKVAFWVFAAFLCVILGYFAQRKGTEYIREMRQMERVPKVSANHVISGEVSAYAFSLSIFLIKSIPLMIFPH